MNKQTSIYLDLLRFLAAMAVFIGHFPNKGFSGPSIPIINLGPAAVILFFVLSGYVIAFISERDNSFKTFAINRIARLWSVIIPAIILTCVLFFIGTRINQSVYKDVLACDKLLIRIIFNLFFLQGIQNHAITLLNNGPFWSLANEFWYYCIFAIFVYGKKTSLKFSLITLILIFVGGNIALLFPIWVLGIIIYKSNRYIKMNKISAWILYITSIFLFSLKCFSKIFSNIESPLIHQYIWGLIFSLHLFSAQYIKIQFITFLESASKFLSSFTFSLYLFHMPFLYFFSSFINYDKNDTLHIAFIATMVLLCVFTLSLVTERKKNYVKMLINFSLTFVTSIIFWLKQRVQNYI